MVPEPRGNRSLFFIGSYDKGWIFGVSLLESHHKVSPMNFHTLSE
jgi:hypothetical protein